MKNNQLFVECRLIWRTDVMSTFGFGICCCCCFAFSDTFAFSKRLRSLLADLTRPQSPSPGLRRLHLTEIKSLIPLTHAPETGARNRRQKTGVGFWSVCHTIWCQICLAPDSGVG